MVSLPCSVCTGTVSVVSLPQLDANHLSLSAVEDENVLQLYSQRKREADSRCSAKFFTDSHSLSYG